MAGWSWKGRTVFGESDCEQAKFRRFQVLCGCEERSCSRAEAQRRWERQNHDSSASQTRRAPEGSKFNVLGRHFREHGLQHNFVRLGVSSMLAKRRVNTTMLHILAAPRSGHSWFREPIPSLLAYPVEHVGDRHGIVIEVR
jgi:hypothetical protein